MDVERAGHNLFDQGFIQWIVLIGFGIVIYIIYVMVKT